MSMSPHARSFLAGLFALGTLTVGTSAVHSQDFASQVVDSSHLSTDPLFSDPSAALGHPTTQDDDTYGDVYTPSLVNPVYGQDPTTHSNLLVQLDDSGAGTLTVEFAQPVVHSDAHWYGADFIIFDNSFFLGNTAPDGTGQPYVTSTTDLDHYYLTDGTTYPDPQTLASRDTKVYVSPDDNPAHFIQVQPEGEAGGYPISPDAWVSATTTTAGHFGAAMDFTKPVNPTLGATDFSGHTAASAINTLYNGSAGGTAFSLDGTGYSSIQFIKITGSSTVIDGISRVGFDPAAAPEPGVFLAFALGAAGLGVLGLRCRRA